MYFCRCQQTGEQQQQQQQIATVAAVGKHTSGIYEEIEENRYSTPNFGKPFPSPFGDYDQLNMPAPGLNTAGRDQSISDYYNL